jgi:acetyl esterase/lipase
MPLDPHASRFLERLAAVNPPQALSLSVAERRAALRTLLSFAAPAPVLEAVAELACDGPGGQLTLRAYTPHTSDGARLPGVVYFHGGGLVAGSLDTHDAIARNLCAASGCRLFAVGYRLAPEARFPAAVQDALAATSWVAARATELGIDARRLVVGGDSAGATLAAVVCQLAASQGLALALQFLLCPILDYAEKRASRREFASGYLVDEGTLQHDLRHYLTDDAQRFDARVSPLRAVQLTDLPAACIHTAEFDPLRDEGREYADRLRRAGVTVRYRCHDGMIHLFYGLGAVIPAATAAYALMGADIRAMLPA